VSRFDGKCVLIVDDEFAVVEALTEVLAWRGLVVLNAPSGPEALRLLEAERPDFIVVDYMMPAMNGIELCRKIRSLEWTRDVPVVLISAALGPPPGPNGLWNTFLRKPFDEASLFRALEEAAEKMAGHGLDGGGRDGGGPGGATH
jgi:two-component system phosphate regulon response regulator PhoB